MNSFRKMLTALSCTLLFFSVSAQNYRMFTNQQKVYFRNTATSFISNHPAEQQQSSHNLIIVHPELKEVTVSSDYLFDLQSPLLDSFVVLQNGDQKLIGSTFGTILIPANVNIGDSWIGVDAETDLNIEYASKNFEMVHGQLDSVKTFLINSNREMKISKAYGLISVPYSTTGQYKMVLYPPLRPELNYVDFRSLYAFHVGYIYGGLSKDIPVRYEIIEKTVRADSTIFSIECRDKYNNTINLDTAELVIKADRIISSNATLLEDIGGPNMYKVDYSYVSFKDSDTIFAFGEYNISTPGTGRVHYRSARQGFYGHFNFYDYGPLHVFEDLSLRCFYPKASPTLGCENIEDLTPVFEDALVENNIAVYYNPDSREISLTSETGPSSQVSLIDTQGKVRYSSSASNAVSIPCQFANGYYLLLIESEKGNFRKSVSVY